MIREKQNAQEIRNTNDVRCLQRLEITHKSGKKIIHNCKIQELFIDSNDLAELVFENSVINRLVLGNNTIQSITFSECVIGEFTIIDQPKLNLISFNNCFLVSISSNTSRISIALSGGYFKLLTIKNGIQTLTLNKTGAEHRKIGKLSVKEGFGQIKATNVFINGIEFGDIRSNFSNNKISDLTLHDSSIENIRFLYSNNASFINNIEIENCYISDKLWLRNIRFDKFEIKGLSIINNFEIDEIENWGKILISNMFGSLQLTKLKTGELKNILSLENVSLTFFTIEDCILDHTEFNKVDLDGIVSIKNSSVTQAKIHSITWPSSYRINEKNEENKESYILKRFKDLRETYRQLKVLSLKGENKIDAKFFLNNELRIYYQMITFRTFGKFAKLNAHKYFPFNILLAGYSLYFLTIPLTWPMRNNEKIKSFRYETLRQWRDFGDWIILHTNATFSKFGESLGRPILWLLAFHSLFFYLLITKFPDIGIEVDFKNWNHDWEVFWQGLNLYTNLISPVHGNTLLSITDPIKEVPIFSIADFFMRISSGYFIYYFIRATRKFNFSV